MPGADQICVRIGKRRSAINTYNVQISCKYSRNHLLTTKKDNSGHCHDCQAKQTARAAAQFVEIR